MMKRSGKMYEPSMSGPADKARTERDVHVGGGEPSISGTVGKGGSGDPSTKNTMESGSSTPSDHCKNTIGHKYG